MEVFLTPQNIYIGDEVECMIALSELSIDKTVFNDTVQKHKTLETETISILGIELKQTGKEQFVVIRFKAWRAGEIIFPSLRPLGILSDIPSITIQSLLSENTTALQEENTPLLIPGTVFLFVTVGFIGITFFLFIFMLYQRLFKLNHKRNKKYALKKLQRKTKKLFKNKSINTKLFIIETEQNIRTFLSGYFNCFAEVHISALTFTEIKNILTANEESEKIISSLTLVMHSIEAVRFNNAPLDKNVFSQAIHNFIIACRMELQHD